LPGNRGAHRSIKSHEILRFHGSFFISAAACDWTRPGDSWYVAISQVLAKKERNLTFTGTMAKRIFRPDKTQFESDMKAHRLVPVSTQIVADLDTPLTLFSKVADGRSHAFLFESMEGGEKWGRFSFIGYDPLVTFTSTGDSVTIKHMHDGGSSRTFTANPLTSLKSLIDEIGAADYAHLPRFCGGAVGFLGYDMVRFMEDLPDDRPATELPDSSFMLPKIVLVHDSFKQTVTVVTWVQTDGGDGDTLYAGALVLINEVIDKIKRPVAPALFQESSEGCEPHIFTSNMERDQFTAMVERAKEYILAATSSRSSFPRGFIPLPVCPPWCFTGPYDTSIPARIFFICV